MLATGVPGGPTILVGDPGDRQLARGREALTSLGQDTRILDASTSARTLSDELRLLDEGGASGPPGSSWWAPLPWPGPSARAPWRRPTPSLPPSPSSPGGPFRFFRSMPRPSGIPGWFASGPPNSTSGTNGGSGPHGSVGLGRLVRGEAPLGGDSPGGCRGERGISGRTPDGPGYPLRRPQGRGDRLPLRRASPATPLPGAHGSGRGIGGGARGPRRRPGDAVRGRLRLPGVHRNPPCRSGEVDSAPPALPVP